MNGDAPRWFAVAASVPETLADEIAPALAVAGLGVEIEATGVGRSRLRAYFSVPEAASAAERAAVLALAAHGLDPSACGLRVEPVADGRWAERYQASLRPFPLGTRFLVVPGGDAAPGPGRTPLHLGPGMAFGTGEHPTTRLCAEALEREVRAGSRWLDLGCGTGILSLVAAHLGARAVTALDVDPEAAGVAREVVRVNGLDGVVAVVAGSLPLAAAERFDGVAANIASSFFLSRAGAIADVAAPGCTLVASGFLEEDLPEIEAALAAAGFRPERRHLDRPWAALTARRGAA